MMPRLARECRESVEKQVREFGFCSGASYRREEHGGDFLANAVNQCGRAAAGGDLGSVIQMGYSVAQEMMNG